MFTKRSSYNSLSSIYAITIDYVVDLNIVAAKIIKNSILTLSLTLSEAEALAAAVALQLNSVPRALFVYKPHINEARGIFPHCLDLFSRVSWLSPLFNAA